MDITRHSYILVRWLHSFPDEPVAMWSELDEDRREVRKVEIWSSGRVGHAFLAGEVGGTGLGEIPVPPFNEISRDPQFQAQSITKAEFETCWDNATGDD